MKFELAKHTEAINIPFIFLKISLKQGFHEFLAKISIKHLKRFNFLQEKEFFKDFTPYPQLKT